MFNVSVVIHWQLFNLKPYLSSRVDRKLSKSSYFSDSSSSSSVSLIMFKAPIQKSRIITYFGSILFPLLSVHAVDCNVEIVSVHFVFRCLILVKTVKICEIHGFAIFQVFTYPLFLECSDFQECSDYVVFDFLHNRISIKIQFLMQPEKSCNQAFHIFGFLVFHCSFFLIGVLLIFARFPKGHRSRCKRA